MSNLLIRLVVMVVFATVLLFIYNKHNFPRWLKDTFTINKPYKGIMTIIIIGVVLSSSLSYICNIIGLTDTLFNTFLGILLGFTVSLVPELVLQ